MPEFSTQFTILTKVLQEHRGEALKYSEEVVCEKCGSNVTPQFPNEMGITVNDLRVHMTYECVAIPRCHYAECKLFRHLGDCFHDGGSNG